MNGPALFASARLFISIECLVQGRQVAHEVGDIDFDTMHERAAVKTIPVETV